MFLKPVYGLSKSFSKFDCGLPLHQFFCPLIIAEEAVYLTVSRPHALFFTLNSYFLAHYLSQGICQVTNGNTLVRSDVNYLSINSVRLGCLDKSIHRITDVGEISYGME